MDRGSRIQDRSINLTCQTPLDKIRQLDSQGSYKTRMFWDKFKNGIMIRCEIAYFTGNRNYQRKRILASEAHFVETQSVEHAKNVIAAIILKKLGLYDEPETVEDIVDTSVRMAFSLLKPDLESWAMASEKVDICEGQKQEKEK